MVPGLHNEIHVKIQISHHEFSNMAPDRLAAKLPPNRKPDLNIIIKWHRI